MVVIIMYYKTTQETPILQSILSMTLVVSGSLLKQSTINFTSTVYSWVTFNNYEIMSVGANFFLLFFVFSLVITSSFSFCSPVFL